MGPGGSLGFLVLPAKDSLLLTYLLKRLMRGGTTSSKRTIHDERNQSSMGLISISLLMGFKICKGLREGRDSIMSLGSGYFIATKLGCWQEKLFSVLVA